jgi:hypothetical protein
MEGSSSFSPRHINIIENVEESLQKIISKIKPVLTTVFSTWLRGHALTDPEIWAERRVEEAAQYNESSREKISAALVEYKDYLHNRQQWLQYGQKVDWPSILRELFNSAGDLNSIPSLQEIKNRYQDDWRESLEVELEDSGLEDFNDQQGTDFETEEAAMEYVNNYEVDDYMFFDLYSNEDSLIGELEMFGNVDNFTKEIYQNFVFPQWYRYWRAKGIDETRKNVEASYKMMLEASSIKENITAINVAINTYHQSGSMMDKLTEYGAVSEGGDFEDDLESELAYTEIMSLLSNLSKGKYTEEWNKELKDIGLNI